MKGQSYFTLAMMLDLFYWTDLLIIITDDTGLIGNLIFMTLLSGQVRSYIH